MPKALGWLALAALTAVIAYLGVEPAAEGDGGGGGDTPWLLLALLAAQLCLATASYRADLDGSSAPTPWRVSFHLAGLTLMFGFAGAAITFVDPATYPEDFRALVATAVAAGTAEFFTGARLLESWTVVPAARPLVGQFLIQISAAWTVVVVLLGLAFLRVQVDGLLNDAIVAASVLSLPLVISVNWSLRHLRVDPPARLVEGPSPSGATSRAGDAGQMNETLRAFVALQAIRLILRLASIGVRAPRRRG